MTILHTSSDPQCIAHLRSVLADANAQASRTTCTTQATYDAIVNRQTAEANVS